MTDDEIEGRLGMYANELFEFIEQLDERKADVELVDHLEDAYSSIMRASIRFPHVKRIEAIPLRRCRPRHDAC